MHAAMAGFREGLPRSQHWADHVRARLAATCKAHYCGISALHLHTESPSLTLLSTKQLFCTPL